MNSSLKKCLVLPPLVGWILLSGCQTPPPGTPENLSPLLAEEWILHHPQAQVVDVRTPEEYGTGHLLGARLLPVEELERRVGEIDPGKPVLLYCHSGRRSLQALTLLKARGFKDLHQIEGGITAWKEAKLPLQKEKR